MKNKSLDFLVAKHVMKEDVSTLPEHDWKKNEDGEIDVFALDAGHHNGPMCARCYESYCHHCSSAPMVIDCTPTPSAYSSNMETAMKVVAKVKKMTFSRRRKFTEKLRRQIRSEVLKNLHESEFIFFVTPKHICIAALEAVGKTYEETTQEKSAQEGNGSVQETL